MQTDAGLQIDPAEGRGVFGVGDGCLVQYGGNIKMLVDMECVNHYPFFNVAVVGHQFPQLKVEPCSLTA